MQTAFPKLITIPLTLYQEPLAPLPLPPESVGVPDPIPTSPVSPPSSPPQPQVQVVVEVVVVVHLATAKADSLKK